MVGWTKDKEINRESKAMLREVRRFVSDILQPSAISLDKCERPDGIYEKGSTLWEVFKTYRSLDLHLTRIPLALGGMDDIEAMALLQFKEEMGYADVGLSQSLIASDLPFIFASESSSPRLRECVAAYCKDRDVKMAGALCLSDPFYSTPSLTVEKEGDGHLVNGTLERVANGNFATHALVYIPVPGRENETAFALLPLDLPGVTRSAPFKKLGQRTLNSTTLTFRNVLLSEEDLLTRDQSHTNQIREKLSHTLLFDVSLFYSGLSMAAFDQARAYAKSRIQGGVPIFEHANIRLKLFRLFQMAEVSRAYARRIVSLLDGEKGSEIALQLVSLKCFVTQAASDISCEAIQIFGGNGLTLEYPVEKYFRDAQTGRIETGENDRMAIRQAADL